MNPSKNTSAKSCLPLICDRNHQLQTAFLFVLTICLSALPAGAQPWDGSGTPNEPYLIYDANDMNAIGADPNFWDAHFKLMADIDLSSYTGTQFNIIGNDVNAFTGTFDGNNLTISNFTYQSASSDDIGLFGHVDDVNAEIKDLILIDPNVHGNIAVGSLVSGLFKGTITNCNTEGADISGDRFVGGLCGFNENGSISNCYSTGSVTGGSYSVGGLCGSNGGNISNCYATGSVNGVWAGIGGLCGDNWGNISNCYSLGSVTGGDYSSYLGGLCGENCDGSFRRWGTISNCYSTGSVSGGTEYIGGLCGSNYLFSGSINNSFWDIETGGPDNGVGIPKTTLEMQDPNTFISVGWDFVGERANGTSQIWQITPGSYPVLSRLSGYVPLELEGSGTSENPYLISDANELGAIYHYENIAHYKLTSDIDLLGMTWSIAPISLFNGTFDGDGHTISNLTVDGGGYIGLFGYIGTSGEIYELGLINVSITANFWRVGGLCGWNEGRISNCYITGSVTGSSRLGGLCGENSHNSISGCYANCSITGGGIGSQSLGGLCGFNIDSNLNNCYAAGSVTGGDYSDYVGGLVGSSSHGNVSNCYATGTVTGDYGVGGLVGKPSQSNVSNCYATGNVTGSTYVGGLVGYDSASSYTASFWDSTVNPGLTGIGNITDPCGVIGESTANMQTQSIYTFAGWDFVGETINGANDIWKICNGTNYPKLAWQIPLLGDFVCPDGVEMSDLGVLVEQWLLERPSADVAPDGGDGIVNFVDWAVFANGWEITTDINDLADFAEQWLCVYRGDIGPVPYGDDIVNTIDFAVLADNWLAGVQ